MSKLYTADEVAAKLGISHQRVRVIAKSRDLGTKVGKRLTVFSDGDIENMCQRKVGRPSAQATGAITDILVQLERDGKIKDVSDVKVLVRPRPKDNVICRIKNDDGKTLYIVER